MYIQKDITRILHMITDDDTLSVDDLSSKPTTGEVQRIFEKLGLRWNPLTEEEVANVCSGMEPRYFLSAREFIDQYRRELGVHVPEGSKLHRQMQGSLRSFSQIIDEMREQIEEHGFWYAYMSGWGYACPTEQKRFYGTDVWRRCSAMVRYLHGYRCRMCGKRGQGLHVHHMRPIKSAFSKTCFTNFDEARMELQCEECHKKTHKVVARGGHHFIYTDEAEAIENRKLMQEFWRQCHAKNQCDYCNYFGLSFGK